MTIPELVKEKVRKVIKEIDKKTEIEIRKLREEFEGEKLRIKEKILKEAEDFLKIERAKRIAESRIKALKEILQSREEVFNKLLSYLKDEIKEKRKNNSYRKIFEKLFREALSDFGEDEGRIIVSPDDKKYAENLVKNEKLNFEIIEDDKIFAGLIIERKDGRIRVLNTLESRLKKAEMLLMEKLFKEIFKE